MVRSRVRRQLSRVPGALSTARLLAETFRVCMRYRVTGWGRLHRSVAGSGYGAPGHRGHRDLRLALPDRLRQSLGATVGGTSIYGPRAAPIVVLIWLYFLALAILIGAALNAAARRLWPVDERMSSRARLVTWLKGEATRRREPAHERPLTPVQEAGPRPPT